MHVAIEGWLRQTRRLVRTKSFILSSGHNIFPTNQALRTLLQAIDIDDVLVIITIVSAKQVYSGKVKLFNEIEPFRLRFRFPFHFFF